MVDEITDGQFFTDDEDSIFYLVKASSKRNDAILRKTTTMFHPDMSDEENC